MNAHQKTCICILGMHRSGTSAASGLVSELGYDFGDSLITAAYDNPRGFYENQSILDINEAILARLGYRWDNILELKENWYSRSEYNDLFQQAQAVLQTGFKGANTEVGKIAIKDPRLSQLWAFWQDVLVYAGYKIKILIVYRNAAEVIQSLATRNNFSNEKSAALIVSHLLNAEFQSRQLPRLIISYNELISDPAITTAQLAEFLEDKLSQQSARQLARSISSELHNHKKLDLSFRTNEPTFRKLEALLLATQQAYETIKKDKNADTQLATTQQQFSALIPKLQATVDTESAYLKALIDIGKGYAEKHSIIKDVKLEASAPYHLQLEKPALKLKVLFEHLPNSLAISQLKATDTRPKDLEVQLLVNGYEVNSSDFVFNSAVKQLELISKTDSLIQNLSFCLDTEKLRPRNSEALTKLAFFRKALVAIIAHPINFFRHFNREKLRILKSALGRENPKLILRNFTQLLSGRSEQNSKITNDKRKLASIKTQSANAAKLNLIFVSNDLPDPDKSSGGKRTVEILTILSSYFNIFFYHLGSRSSSNLLLAIPDLSFVSASDLRTLKQQGESVYAIVYSHYYTCSEHGFIAELFHEAKTIVDSVDLHWLREFRSIGIWDGVDASLVKRNKAKELKAYEDSDLVWVVSQEEAKSLASELPDSNVAVVSNIHGPTSKNFIDKGKNKLLFIGGFDHYPNISAAEFIALEILPLVISKIPDVELLIVGHKSIEAVGHLAAANVKVFGSVSAEKLQELYDECIISVAPLLIGAGVKGKITEAIYNMTPVVTNGIGNEGIGLIDGLSGFVADTPAELSYRIVKCLLRKINLEKVANNAIEKLASNYSKTAAKKAIASSLFPKVNICIVTWNRLDLLLACIESILDHTVYPNYMIVVYSNGCTDGTHEYLEFLSEEESRIQPILKTTNDVFVLPNNRMFELDKEADVVMLNNDTVVSVGWLQALWASAYMSLSTGIVGSKLLNADGSLQEFGSEIFMDGTGINYGKGDLSPESSAYAQPMKVPYVSGCSMYIKRSTISAIGKLDESLHPCYYEDSDYCYRAWVAGLHVWVTPHSIVTHLEGATSGTTESAGFKKYQAVNREKFLKKHKGNIQKVKSMIDG